MATGCRCSSSCTPGSVNVAPTITPRVSSIAGCSRGHLAGGILPFLIGMLLLLELRRAGGAPLRVLLGLLAFLAVDATVDGSSKRFDEPEAGRRDRARHRFAQLRRGARLTPSVSSSSARRWSSGSRCTTPPRGSPWSPHLQVIDAPCCTCWHSGCSRAPVILGAVPGAAVGDREEITEESRPALDHTEFKSRHLIKTLCSGMTTSAAV
jgi:hypothetical protein